MRVAVVGAGASGLTSTRHLIKNEFQCDVFEMADQVGGTWVYTDDIGNDKHGFPVYSATYKNLRTNLPKEIMSFPDFPVQIQDKSYLTQEEVLNFLNQYADHFQLRKFIKFNCMVTDIRPTPNKRWQLTYTLKQDKRIVTRIYDAIMICNGHYNETNIPQIENLEKYTGEVKHSHSFRSAINYQGKYVLTIGAGPSGLDLTLELSKVAKKVYFSHHSKEVKTAFPNNVEIKPDVKCIINEKTVEFTDGSCCEADFIVLCTGYKYSFPFLHESCGVTVDKNYIQPLYRHMIHLEKPTMCFIGLPFNVCPFPMFDLQARYFCRLLSGLIRLPSIEEMRRHTESDLQDRLSKGLKKKQAHWMGEYQQAYYNGLATEANILIPPVYIKLQHTSLHNLYNDIQNFREYKYQVVDDENFIKLE